MCGVFGFVGHKPLDPSMLNMVASRAAERGPDGFGIAYKIDKQISVVYGDGSLLNSMDSLKCATPSVAVLGHCRLPTQGKRSARHPFKCGDGWLVHNGNAYNIERYGHIVDSHCDSEAVAAEVSVRRIDSGDDLWDVAKELHGQVPFVVAMLTPSKFAVARNGHPMFFVQRDEGCYFSSRCFGESMMLTKSFYAAI